ncbi:MAG: hypothetical protein HLUCCO16_00805 [Phormidium sp. OSCR]|nr:MAG: hypothetical protein HLUCCO16_00805 [Phormidium sp. OSCR]
MGVNRRAEPLSQGQNCQGANVDDPISPFEVRSRRFNEPPPLAYPAAVTMPLRLRKYFKD